ncbi:MAG: hypothetical protein LM591_06265 [Candidatus Korarchaeum sp.]|jgi:predicted aspartyl protease|nr:hypothetical protein [Candidatus Korarchaeum sp.]
MPVRVRTRIKSMKGPKAGKIVETNSLLNTGYIGLSPEIIVPLKLAETLGLWPPTGEAMESIYDTAGGPARFYIIERAVAIQIVEDDTVSEELVADAVISPVEREVLLSDFVMGELGIVILNAYRGFWRFSSDPVERVRYSRGPELW